jgi:hypothetical protein
LKINFFPFLTPLPKEGRLTESFSFLFFFEKKNKKETSYPKSSMSKKRRFVSFFFEKRKGRNREFFG